MRQLKVLGLALVALLAVAAAFAGSASAVSLPEVLGGAAPTELTGKSVGVSKLTTLAGTSIECAEANADGELEANRLLGPFHIHFGKSCEAVIGGVKVGKCNTTGDSAGIILVLGTYHIVVDVNTPELGAAVLFLVNETPISCALGNTVTVKGSVLCLIEKPLESNATHTFNCTQTSGTANEREYYTGSGETKAKTSLLSKLNAGAFEEAGEAAKATVTFPAAVTIMD